MPKLRHNESPRYRLHKQSGQAIVTLGGRDVLLGKHNTPASQAEYERLIHEWRVSGRQAPQPADDLTISELMIRYRTHVTEYYRRPDKTPTGEAETIRLALRPLRRLYGETTAKDFGPLQLEAVRDFMVRLGWARKTINKQINRVRQFFKWAVAKGHVPGSVLEGLRAVAPLRQGRTEARETEPIRPVPEEYVEAIIPRVSRHVAGMIRLQLLTGARPGELCIMRTCDIDRSGRVWIYRPEQHKTVHRGHGREIRIGPRGQAVLAPFLKTNLTAHVFSPGDAEAERRAEMHRRRKTPPNAGNVPGSNRRRKPRWRPGDHYTPESYLRAVTRGCDLAFPPPVQLAKQRIKGQKGMRLESIAEWRDRLGPERWAELRQWQRDHRWHPHQLRHNAATRIRREHGLDMARVILGQRSLDVTEIYAEADTAKASAIMEQIG